MVLVIMDEVKALQMLYKNLSHSLCHVSKGQESKKKKKVSHISRIFFSKKF